MTDAVRLPAPPSRTLAEGLAFPEGPVAMPDGSVLLVEVRRGTLTRVDLDGTVSVVAELGVERWGGPNGAAVGPDGAVYVCHNGGFPWSEVAPGAWSPVDPVTRSMTPPGWDGGWISRVDLATGEHRVLYDRCDDHHIGAPNDLVFDDRGGFWFTDFGKDAGRSTTKGGVYYATADGTSIVEAIFPLLGANGVGLSPDGSELYVAETSTGRVWAFDVDGPGRVRGGRNGGRCLANTLGHLDSLAVEADGRVCVAAIGDGILVVDPDGRDHHYVAVPDRLTTNVCFGGPDGRTAYVTGSGAGVLLALEWPRPGLVVTAP